MNGKDAARVEHNLTVSLKEYVDTLFAEKQRAIDKAENSMNTRLEGMNEFRNTLKDQAGKFVTREEIGITLRRLNEDVRGLEKKSAQAEGKASQSSAIFAAVVALAGLVLGLFNLLGK